MDSTNFTEAKDRIREERKRLGLRQEDAAEKCGLSRSMWIRYEKGQSVLDGEALRKFIAIGADGAYILGGVRGTAHGQAQLQTMLGSTENLPESDKNRLDALALQIAQDDAIKYENRKAQYAALIRVLHNFDDELFHHTLRTIDLFEDARRKALMDNVKS